MLRNVVRLSTPFFTSMARLCTPTQVLVAQAGVPRGDAARGGEVPVPLRQPVGSLLEGAVPRGAPVKVGPLQVD